MQQRMLTIDLTNSNQLPNQLQPRNRIKSYCTFSMGFMKMFVMVVSGSIPICYGYTLVCYGSINYKNECTRPIYQML